jgi:hypothetical protein
MQNLSSDPAQFGPTSSRFWTSPWPTFIAVIAVDLVLVITFLRPFLTAPGPLIYGDLGAVYTYGGVQERWILTASVYQAVEQAGSLFAPWPAIQNSLYVATFVLPSVGIFWFLEIFSESKPVVGLVAVVLGTVMNPVFYGDLIQGGQEYGLWLLFTFLGLRFLCASLLDDNRRLWEPALAGVLFGLGSSQSFGQTGMATGAVLLSGPMVIGILAYDLLRARGSAGERRAIAGIGLFLAAYAALLIPLVYADLSQANGVLGAASQTAALSSKTLGNISYTFRPYGFAAALFAVPPVPTPDGYTAPLSAGWALVVLASLAGGLIGWLYHRGVRRWLSAIFLASFLGFALYIVGLGSGALLPLYARIPPLDLLDGPDLLVYAEYLSLPFLLLICFEWLQGASARALTARVLDRARRIIGRPRTGPPRAWSTRRASPKFLRQRVTVVVCLLVVVGVVIASAYPVLADLDGRVDSNPSVAPNMPYAPSAALNAIHAWYAGVSSTLEGFVLPLPDDGHGYGAIQGVIPLSQLWVIPLYANDLVSDYNSTAYVDVMRSLANGSVDAWASQIGASGVQYIVLAPFESSVTIAPSYLTGAPGPVNYTELGGWLDESTSLSAIYRAAGVSIFVNREFVPAGHVLPGAVGFSAAEPRTTTATAPALPAGGFRQWDIWPPARSSIEPNGSLVLNVNYSASPQYVVLWAPLSAQNNSNESAASLSLDPLYHRSVFRFSDAVDVPSDARLQAYVAWYNTTSPASLFAWFATSDLSVSGTGVTAVTGILTAPVAAVAARVVYTAFPDSVGTNTDVLAAPPVATASVATLDLAQDVPAEVSTANALTASDVLPVDILDLVYPVGTTPEGGPLPVSDEVSLAPADTFDPWSLSDFPIPLVPSNFPDLLSAGHAARLSLEITGFENGSTDGSNATWSIAGVSEARALPPGRFSVDWTVPSGLLGQSGLLSFRGNVTLSLVALAVTNISSTARADSATALNLPIGTGALIETAAGPELSPRVPPDLGSSASVSPWDAAPIPGAAAVMALALVAPRLRRHRRPEVTRREVSHVESEGAPAASDST